MVVSKTTVLLIYTLSLTLSVFCEHVCITNDLEGDFEEQFSMDRDCVGQTRWQSGKYEDVDLNPPHPRSSSFIFSDVVSCARTNYLFAVTAGSNLQVNFFLNTTSAASYLFVYVYGMSDSQTGIPVSVGTVIPPLFPNGWHVLNIPIGQNMPQAYIAFVGGSPVESTILIDSFRYFNSGNIMEACSIYPEVDSREHSEEDGEIVPGCITANLEEDIDDKLVSDRECDQFPYEPWVHDSYENLNVTLDVNGTKFIRPGAIGSCARTVDEISVINGGVFEFNLYLKMAQQEMEVAYFSILVQNLHGHFLGATFLNSNIHSDGWHTISIDIYENDSNAYILFIGAVPDGSILLLDSYRYGHSWDKMNTCNIYSDGGDTEVTPTEQPDNSGEGTTTEQPDSSLEGTTTEQPDSSLESTTTEQPELSEEDTDDHPVDPEGENDSDEETKVEDENTFICNNTCVCNCSCKKKDSINVLYSG